MGLTQQHRPLVQQLCTQPTTRAHRLLTRVKCTLHLHPRILRVIANWLPSSTFRISLRGFEIRWMTNSFAPYDTVSPPCSGRFDLCSICSSYEVRPLLSALYYVIDRLLTQKGSADAVPYFGHCIPIFVCLGTMRYPIYASLTFRVLHTIVFRLYWYIHAFLTPSVICFSLS